MDEMDNKETCLETVNTPVHLLQFLPVYQTTHWLQCYQGKDVVGCHLTNSITPHQWNVALSEIQHHYTEQPTQPSTAQHKSKIL